MTDCRTCKHNSYRKLISGAGWVSCSHPVTLAKTPRWENGDPEFVNAMTGDIPIARISELQNCPTYEDA
jgi:hypothetical protein